VPKVRDMHGDENRKSSYKFQHKMSSCRL
jgi:hypothetical protein